MMKKEWGMLVMVAAWLALGMPAGAAELKVGVVEPQKVLDSTKAGKKIKDAMDDYLKTRQKVLDQDADDLKKLQEDLVKQGTVLSAEAKRDKEEAIQRKAGEYQRKLSQYNQEVQNKRREMLEQFSKQLDQVVRAIAEKEKLSLVVEKGGNGSAAFVIYSHPSLDLTDRVIKELDKGAP